MKPNYYAIIPADVRYSNLKPNAKLLYGEITALSSKEGYCFATNNYFAKLYDVTKNTISLWVSQLNKEEFISVELIKKGEQITERRIGIIKNDDRAIIKNNDLSTTSISNTNNISNREDKFITEVLSLETNEDIRKDFILYWSEKNISKSKMRYELEKTWNTLSRIQRWKKNISKWNNPIKNSKIEATLSAHQQAKEMILKMNNQ